MASSAAQRFSFRAYAWGQLKRNRPAYISLWVLSVMGVMAIFAPIIANDQPIYALYKGHHLFPALSFKNVYHLEDPFTKQPEVVQLDIFKWKEKPLGAVIWPIVPYSANGSDLLNSGYVAPGGKQNMRDSNGLIVPLPMRFRHWLGTNKRGEDVLAGLIHASRISLSIGVLSMLIATVIGLLLGGLAGYYGDDRLRTSRGIFILLTLGIVLGYYYGFQVRSHLLSDAIGSSGSALFFQLMLSLGIFSGTVFLFYHLGNLSGRLPWLGGQTSVAIDSIISRAIEILISVPTFILIISISAIARPSIFNLMLIIGLTRWTGIARFARAEFLRIRNLEYIKAGQALGFSEARIIFLHALPNGLAPALVAIAFGIASSILVESSLSFLGLGVPPNVVTWGSLLSSGRENFAAWWMVVYPGMAIFIAVTVYNLLGEGLRDALDPRLKQ